MPLDDYHARTPQAAMKRAVASFASRAEHEVSDLQAAIAHERPDGLLIDGQTWGALAVAEAWGGPWASWLPYPMPLFSPQVPPFGPGLAPARGALGQIRDSALRLLLVPSVERTLLPPLNGVRAGLNLDPLTGAGELFTRPPARGSSRAHGCVSVSARSPRRAPSLLGHRGGLNGAERAASSSERAGASC